METNTNQSEIRERINRLFKEFLGSNTDFSYDRYLKSQGLEDLSTLNNSQKRQFAEDMVDRIIRPSTSTGKTSLARVELMSILKIGVEPWKITPDYVPSPREYLLSHEINEELKKLNRQTLYSEVVRNQLSREREPDQAKKTEIVNAIISTIFGTMPRTTLLYTKKLFNKRPLEWVMKNSLSTYMRPEDAEISSKNLTRLFEAIIKTKDEQPKDFNLKILSEKLRDDFTDTNQIVIRRLKNEMNIDDMRNLNENKKQRILQTLMSHYFGQLSEKYLTLEIEKMKLSSESDAQAAEKLRLINAIIHDCLHSTMAAEDAKKAHNDLSFLINP